MTTLDERRAELLDVIRRSTNAQALAARVNGLLARWDREDRVYLPGERQLDVRIDGPSRRLAAV
jgi:hypothetical protein